jgi:hypothetical protein
MGPRGLRPCPRHRGSEEPWWTTILILAPVQRSWSARIISDRLPWDSSGRRSRGCWPSAPPSTSLSASTLARPASARRRTFTSSSTWRRGLHPRRSRSVLVVSHHLDGFLRRGRSRVEPKPDGSRHTRRSRACCIPLPILGFAVFPAPSARGMDPKTQLVPRSRSPQRRPHGEPCGRFTPLEEFPSTAAVLRLRSLCPPGVHPALRSDDIGARCRDPASPSRHACATFRALLRDRVL